MNKKHRVTLDTNILVYAFDITDRKRQKKAIEIIEFVLTEECVLTLQSLSEFYYAVTKKKFLDAKKALAQIQDWELIFPIITAKASTLIKAIKAVEQHQLSFWDALLWATAKEANIEILFTEDFNHTQKIEGVEIINPFIRERECNE
ncbi:MAG: PIN domain-containing protein [Gammaproteobacteria bacterium]|nr:PIN domain-containing protein [Gammaproteobacteria bacterium]